MNEYHILIITDLGTLRADHPILNAVTMSEVITLPITQSFLKVSRGLSSKGVPVFIRCVAQIKLLFYKY